MVMTSASVRSDLDRVEWLIAGLTNSFPGDLEDLDDLYWLEEQRVFLKALLAMRAAQRGKKVVNLALWRDGAASAKRFARAA